MSPEDCRLAAAYIRVSTDDQVELSPPPSWWRFASGAPPTAILYRMSLIRG